MAVDDPSASVSIEPLCPPDRHGDVSYRVTLNPRFVGRPYRYFYAYCIVGPRPCNSYNGLCRVDVTDGTVLTWSDSPNALPAGERSAGRWASQAASTPILCSIASRPPTLLAL